MTPLDPLMLAPAAFAAGVLMFLAPCTLPLVPSYLAFIAGTTEGAVQTTSTRRRVVLNAVAFVVGFSFIFILLGSFAGFVGSHFLVWKDALARAAGAIIILFGFTMLGLVRVPVLSVERRAHIPHFLTLGKPQSSFLIGMLFALGWSPCIGPILGSVLLFASTSSTALQGALLLGIFSLGLAVPFVATAFVLGEAGALFASWGRTVHALSIFGGVVLIVLGVLMLFGEMSLLISWGFGGVPGYSALLRYM